MLIENEFTVQAPAEQVYRLMLDVESVAPCIPGTEVIGRRDDGSYDAKVSVKMGPMTMGYKGSLAIAEQDDVGLSAVMQAKGAEQRGQGNAQAKMTMAVTDLGADGSRVKVSSDILVTGRVAQMGRGIMQDVATRMMAEMARCVEEHLTSAPTGDGSGAAPASAPASSDAPTDVEAAATEPASAPAPEAPTAASAAAPSATTTAAPPAAAPTSSTPPPAAATPPRPRPAAPAAVPIKGGRLIVSVIGDRIRALVRRVRK